MNRHRLPAEKWRQLPRKRISSPYSWRELAGVILRNITGPNQGARTRTSFLERASCWSAGSEDFTICFTGDWMPLAGKDLVFSDDTLRFFRDADAVICNFEGVSIPGGRKVVMQQVHGPETVRALSLLAPADRMILSCANNHSADHGFEFFRDHCLWLESLGYRIAGSLDRPEVTLAPGIILEAGTDWSNHPGPYLAEPTKREGLSGSPKEFRILYCHWGFELELHPRPEMVDRARSLLYGRDMIVGHHPHTPAPCTRLHIGGEDRPVAFSLGNFCTVSRSAKNRWGMVIRAVLGRNAAGVVRLRRLEWHFSHVRRVNGRIEVQLKDRCPYFPEAPVPVLENASSLR